MYLYILILLSGKCKHSALLLSLSLQAWPGWSSTVLRIETTTNSTTLYWAMLFLS